MSETSGHLYGLVPYDLASPPSLPLLHEVTRGSERTEVTVGSGEDKAVLRKTHWHACRDGCCPAGDVWQIMVPCDQVPHCNACECPSEHIVTLSGEDLAKIRGRLP